MSVRKWLALSILGLTAAAMIAAALTPSIRDAVQDKFNPVGREILATVEGDLLNDGQSVRVIKYSTRDGLFVEVLSMVEGENSKLIDQIQLPDKHDGLFSLQGNVTRLALSDIDQDGSLELIAPSFDNQLVPHLNVFRYNPATRHLELYQPNGN